MDEINLKKILASGNFLSPEELASADKAAQVRKISLADYLLSEALITKDLLGQALSEYYQVPYANLKVRPPSRDQILQLSFGKAQKYQAIVFKSDSKEVVVVTANPGEKNLLSELKETFRGKDIKLAYAPFDEIEPFFVYYRKPLETRFSKIVAAQKMVAPEIIDEIISDALAYRASDIHLEPQENDVEVRFRVDGVLREAGRIPSEQYPSIVNHIKVRTHMRIDEHFSAQDGALRYSTSSEPVDLRVSVVPTLEGERVSIRVLARYVQSLSLGELGISLGDQKTFLAAARKPFGMILAVGPTGSGKTTTLYSLIRILNQPEVNIMTIEDPVEYKVQGVNQIQVNPQTNLTFSEGLKSIIRQDPNIILVGEIRDEETAEIAVNASLTGHLLLSTFHANDAASAIPRLLDMGIEPFLLSSTLELVLAQRLVRKICPSCRYTVADSKADVGKNLPSGFGKDTPHPTALYQGKGCSVCSGSGYQGRTAIFELIQVTPQLRELILKSASSGQIRELVLSQGAHTIFEDGIRKVERGITTIEELMRVAPAA
jgi:type IV pilus assembly protein PilB